MVARGKFGEHERCVSLVRFEQLWLLECSPNFPSASITRYTTPKSMSEFFYNIADKNGCFLVNCKILVTHDTENQTLLLAGYKHAIIV